ncbi:MAG: hypothetical protein QOD74_698 [Variibacter sp.]|jgi:hypothetical protein|nr:hypothetical protein [Variibacter sp.]
MRRTRAKQFAICVDNEGYAAALEKRKIYVVLPDENAEAQGLFRVLDESGDDYLYPKAFFRPIALPQSVKKAVLAA